METLSHFIRDLDLGMGGSLSQSHRTPKDSFPELRLLHEVLLCFPPPTMEPSAPFVILHGQNTSMGQIVEV